MKKKLKIAIAICVVIAVILLIVLAVINKEPVEENKPTTVNEVIEQTPIATTKKIANYINIISGDYYMRYKTYTTDENGEEAVITAEYAISGDKMVFNYEEALTTTIVTKEATYYIVHQNESILKYPIEEEAQEGFSGFQTGYTMQFFETSFIGTGTEDIKETPYYYEEYKNNIGENSTIRYYFDEKDNLKFIKNIDDGVEELTEVLVLSTTINEELFDIPSDYTEYDINELTNTVSE